jgi:hypothetical protein
MRALAASESRAKRDAAASVSSSDLRKICDGEVEPLKLQTKRVIRAEARSESELLLSTSSSETNHFSSKFFSHLDRNMGISERDFSTRRLRAAVQRCRRHSKLHVALLHQAESSCIEARTCSCGVLSSIDPLFVLALILFLRQNSMTVNRGASAPSRTPEPAPEQRPQRSSRCCRGVVGSRRSELKPSRRSR